MCKLNFPRQVMAFLYTGLFISMFSSLAGCSSDGEERPDYLDTNSVKHLEVPPKLSVPDTSGAMSLPKPSAKAQNAFADRQNGSTVIAPAFKGMSLKNDSRLYWLEIDSSVEKVWAMLPAFLAAEGIKVERVEKLMGFVDTKWMNEYQVSYGGEEDSGWFSDFSPDYKDKFRLRVEAAGKGAKSRLYVTHRGMQIVVTSDASEWAQRETEPFLEREIMYRFMLFAGVSKHSATNLLANYRSYQSRVVESKGKLSEFDIQGNRESIWQRLSVAMDRLGVDIVKTDKSKGKLQVLVGNLNTVKKSTEENEGWFSGIFGKDIDVDDDEDYEGREYKKPEVAAEDRIILNVQQMASKNSSTIKLSLEDGSEIEDGLALDFRNALLAQLK